MQTSVEQHLIQENSTQQTWPTGIVRLFGYRRNVLLFLQNNLNEASYNMNDKSQSTLISNFVMKSTYIYQLIVRMQATTGLGNHAGSALYIYCSNYGQQTVVCRQ